MFDSIQPGEKRYVDRPYEYVECADLSSIPKGTRLEAIDSRPFWHRNLVVKATPWGSGGFIDGQRIGGDGLDLSIRKESFLRLPGERRREKSPEDPRTVNILAKNMTTQRALEIRSAVMKVLAGKHYRKGLRHGDTPEIAQSLTLAVAMRFSDDYSIEHSFIPDEYVPPKGNADKVSMETADYRKIIEKIALGIIGMTH